MRIIAGDFKGRPLSAVPGKGTRPTTDKVRESIFNMIGPYFEGGTVLDLYAGTGGLGIESLSRGMDKAIFIDIDPKAITVIKENVSSFRLDHQVEIYRTDSNRALKALNKRGLQFDLVFLDPPYAKQKIAEEIQLLQDYHLLMPDASIVAEHDAEVDLPEEIGRYAKVRFVTYGDTTVSIYEVAQ